MCLATASVIATVLAAGVSIVGQQQQAAAIRRQEGIRQQQFELRQQAAQQNQQAIQQDIAQEQDDERLRQRLLSQEGGQQRGQIRVAQAGLGQLVDEGSAADITSDLAAEVALRKLISQNESSRRQRNLQIESQNVGLEGDILGLEARESAIGARARSGAATAQGLGTVLTTGSTLTRRFKFSNGGITFRT